MKKYLLGLLAITVAFATVAFTPKEDQTMVYFTFTGETDEPTDVENKSLWIEQSNQNCSGSAKACQIAVEEGLLSVSGPGRTLEDADLTITAEEHGNTGHFKPNVGEEEGVSILNKP